MRLSLNRNRKVQHVKEDKLKNLSTTGRTGRMLAFYYIFLGITIIYFITVQIQFFSSNFLTISLNMNHIVKIYDLAYANNIALLLWRGKLQNLCTILIYCDLRIRRVCRIPNTTYSRQNYLRGPRRNSPGLSLSHRNFLKTGKLPEDKRASRKLQEETLRVCTYD